MKDLKLDRLYDLNLWAEALQHIAKNSEKDFSTIYELDLLSNKSEIRGIIQDIKKGTYKIGVPTVVKIRKDNGGYREIYVNSVRDRVVLRVINSIYQELYLDKIHRLCVSYKKGISTGSVVTKISKTLATHNLKGYKIDISKFFDSINRESLFKALDTLSTNSMVDKVIKDYYSDDRVFLKEQNTIVERYKGLAQGCALSSFLCNYILRDVDEYFSSCDIYYRYSDDIIIFTKDCDKSLLDKLSNKLNSYGLSINNSKLEKIYSDEWFTFLGYSIKGSNISISKNSLNKFTKEIINRSKRCKTYTGFKRSIYSYIFSENPYECRGWFGIKVGTINCIDDVKCIDIWVRDMLLAKKYGRFRIGSLGYDKRENGVVSRGKGKHVKRNKELGLEELEYTSMVNLYKLYRINSNLYINELIRRGIV